MYDDFHTSAYCAVGSIVPALVEVKLCVCWNACVEEGRANIWFEIYPKFEV